MMQKIFTTLTIGLLSLSAFASGQSEAGISTRADKVSGEGVMTVTKVHYSTRQETPAQYKVTATYENDKLTIDNFGGFDFPITFVVNPETGDATATDQIAYYYSNSIDWPVYYSDEKGRNCIVNGKFVNTGDGKSKLTADPWGDYLRTNSTNGFVGDYYFYNTEVILDFEIPGQVSEDINGAGAMTATKVHYSTRQETPAQYQVTATYGNNKLTIDNFGGFDFPITFVVNPETGAATATDQIAYYYSNSIDWPVYYSDEKGRNCIVNGKFVNTGDGKSKLTADPWGDFLKRSNGFLGDYYFYDTEVILDFEVPGLIEDGTSAVNSLVNDEGTVRYFNLNGQEITNPQPGTICVRVKGTTATKVLVK